MIYINDLLEILQHPEDQYALKGSTITITCKTRATQANWVLNKTAINEFHPCAEQHYTSLGVTFMDTMSDGYHNLTMTAPASLPLNNTRISCAAKGSSVSMSNEASLIVYNDFSKRY